MGESTALEVVGPLEKKANIELIALGLSYVPEGLQHAPEPAAQAFTRAVEGVPQPLPDVVKRDREAAAEAVAKCMRGSTLIAQEEFLKEIQEKRADPDPINERRH